MLSDILFFFFFFLSVFVGGLAIREIDGRSCLCVFAPASTLLLSSLQPPSREAPLVPDDLPRSPPIPSPHTTSNLSPSRPFTFNSFFLDHTSIFFFCLRLCPFHTPSFFPLTCCVGLPCLPLCSLHPLCTVSVSMVTPRGQEWLRGL